MTFEQIKLKIIQLAQDDGNIELLWLYGSHAKGTAHKQSDIDLAIGFKAWEKDILERYNLHKKILIDVSERKIQPLRK